MDFNLLKSIKKSEYWLHQTKKNVLLRFLIVFSIFVVYLILMTLEYGVDQGVMVGLLTWSFFVFCTPVADASFLVAFPARLLAKVRMVKSQAIVWVIAAVLNAYALSTNPAVYDANALLQLFKEILLNPVPFWLILVLSAIGTFFSVYFGDELIDVKRHADKEKSKKHGKKHKIIITLFIAVTTILLYYYLLTKLGISI